MGTSASPSRCSIPGLLIATGLLACPSSGGRAAEGLAWDLKTPPPETTAVYFRSAQGGQRGVPVVTGDFNGDGLTDVAGSPFSASTSGRTDNGYCEIVFGDGTFGAVIDTGDYPGARLVIHGATDRAFLGLESHVADFDGDGFDDLVLGGNHGVHRDLGDGIGEAVLLYGRPEWGTGVTTLDMAALPPGQRARFFVGRRPLDRLGSWFTIDDLDGDGALDLVAGMDLYDGPGNDIQNTGAAVIFWDAHGSFPGRTLLRAGDPETAGADTIIHGIDARDMMGATHHSGDYDGDGARDLAITAGVTRSGLAYSVLYGANTSSGGGDGPLDNRTNAGETYILWNAGALRGTAEAGVGGALPDGVGLTTIFGESASGYFGEELMTGDLNGDGVDDFAAGALLARNPATSSQTGAAFLLPGGAALRSLATIDLASPPAGMVIGFYGTEPGAIAGDTLEAADMNRDGVDDLFYAIPYGNPGGRTRAGYTVVIYGGQAFPTLPARILVDRATQPDLMTATLLGVDPEDYLAYSSAIGDINADGVADYVANAMNGDGFNNSHPSAGEYYIVDGLAWSRRAAAPTGIVRAEGAPAGQPVLSWTSSQPVLGPVVGYDLLFAPDGGADPVRLRVTGTHVEAVLFGQAGEIRSLRAAMNTGGGEEYSHEVTIEPPLRVTPGGAAAFSSTWFFE